MSSLTRSATRAHSSVKGESMMVPISIASALFAAGATMALKPRRKADPLNEADASTVTTGSDSREESQEETPVAAASVPETPADVAPVQEVNTQRQEQVEEMSLQGSTDSASVESMTHRVVKKSEAPRAVVAPVESVVEPAPAAPVAPPAEVAPEKPVEVAPGKPVEVAPEKPVEIVTLKSAPQIDSFLTAHPVAVVEEADEASVVSSVVPDSVNTSQDSDEVSLFSNDAVPASFSPAANTTATISLGPKNSSSPQKIYKARSPYRGAFSRTASEVLMRAIDDDELSCDSVHC